MNTHHSRCSISITGRDRIHDRGMLLPRTQSAVIRDLTEIPPDTTLELHKQRAKKLVTRHIGNRPVEHAIRSRARHIVIRAHQPRARLHLRTQRIHAHIGRSQRRQSRRLTFQRHAHAKHLVDLTVDRHVYSSPPPRKQINPTILMQRQKRLTHWQPTRTKLRRQITLYQPKPNR